jgi:predicted dehydrogenase
LFTPSRAVRSVAARKGRKKVTSYRVAIIGTGAIAGAHMRALNAMGDRVQVVAGVDVDRSRVDTYCAEHGILHQMGVE